MKRLLYIWAASLLAMAGLSADETYKLGSNDRVALSIYDEPDMSKSVQLTNSGEASFPLIGTINLDGLSLKKAEEEITALYKRDYFVDPQVSLNLVEAAVGQIIVLGAVRSPGPVAVADGGKMSLAAVIATAGGLSSQANPDRIEIKQDGSSKTVSYSSLHKSGAEVMYLRAGAVVNVMAKRFAGKQVTVTGEVGRPGRVTFPPSGDLDVRTAIALSGNLNNGADPNGIKLKRKGRLYRAKMDTKLKPEDVLIVNSGEFTGQTVQMTGKVNKEGRVPVGGSGRLSIIDAITMAGGFHPLANKKKVIVTRKTRKGLETHNVNVDKISKGKKETFFLIPGDTVFVKERWL